MTEEVRDAYDANAELYTALFLGALNEDAFAREGLAAFAKLVDSGTVADLGCGPGHVVDHLTKLGLTAVGYDLSPGLIAEARKAFPELEFHVGDFTALDIANASLSGIVSRYSLIHLHPARLSEVFDEWMRVLRPGAPVIVSFFGSLSAEAHGTPFDHKVVTAYELFPAAIVQQLEEAGFTDVDIDSRPPPEGGRPFSRPSILARKAP